MKRKALVAQSGGPSPVINASLKGVIDACGNYPDKISELYAAYHGIEGVLKEELILLSEQSPEELELLRTTPCSGFIGTCRYKLQEGQDEDYERIIEVFRAHDIGYFFYIGGNDSMDTADKVSKLARSKGYELIVTGIPKTIDNDLGDESFAIIDHTPGYGSAARYWALTMQNADEESRAMHVSECVSVFQAMGRKSGFITAAARLADPGREMPLQLYMAETGHTLESLAENVNRELSRSGRCIVVVNEGFDVGEIGAARDGFGHIEYGASQTTAAQAVVNYLNKCKLNARGNVTGQIPGVIQRGVSLQASTVDLDEAYEVAVAAVAIAMRDGTGFMSTILRKPGSRYEVYYDKVELAVVANSERFMPRHWIAGNGIDVTDDFIRYAAPLIGTEMPNIPMRNGLQRFARLKPVFADKKTAPYVPQTLRRK
ncbi:MAG: diphosphate--fructose-6-phosphate 1-phosphotransferase [Defluviitaleaceae bacterium]|nr:diphosphate--fructose-6-phosphate 1-phosphotransferase [Defluviitaleaceae bacterium]MCL2836744.1 diphosphate--fructose-6-phosphate 1-phosphotransferase [Defluviitaleaceae bacterium]